jgi:hypothetical protein
MTPFDRRDLPCILGVAAIVLVILLGSYLVSGH